VFITTSTFSAEAREYAESVTPRVILVDGRQLAERIIEHGVGVTEKQTVVIKGINLDYFAAGDEVLPAAG
jgi:restriction system protein